MNAQDRDINRQLVDLQSRVAFQEDTLQALNDQLVEQGALLQTQSLQIQLLNKKINDLVLQLENLEGPAKIERPPHY